MSEIAVFGGTFDPPTTAHEAIIQSCLDRPDIDEVWLMPSGCRPDKPAMRSNTARLAMLELVKSETFDNTERLRVTDYEQKLPQPTQTQRTVRSLQRAYPEHAFWFVYGADSYHEMPRWKNGSELRKTIGMLLVPRAGIEIPPESGQVKHLHIGQQHAGTSSTQIRQLCASNHEINGINPVVARYITEHKLYAPSAKIARMCV